MYPLDTHTPLDTHPPTHNPLDTPTGHTHTLDKHTPLTHTPNDEQMGGTHPTGMLCCYHPQHSCGKVMFSQASVILFTGGVWQTPPSGQTPHLGRHSPRADTPPMVTAADGTHPTRMHSCLYINPIYFISKLVTTTYSFTHLMLNWMRTVQRIT